MKRFMIAIAAVVTVLRPLLMFAELNPHVAKSYEAIAHLIVGGLLFGMYWHRRGLIMGGWSREYAKKQTAWMVEASTLLIVAEVLCATAKVLLR